MANKSAKKALEQFKKKCEAWLRENEEHKRWQEINSLLCEVRKYLCVAENITVDTARF